MMKDFTLTNYLNFLSILKAKGYSILPKNSSDNSFQKTIILRHDIDDMPLNALSMAKVENKTGIRSSFFFKTRPGIFIPKVIQQISSFNHEIGYHYEDLVRNHGNYTKAISSFESNLDTLRKVVEVTMICADGNPLSKYNNLWLWEKYDYKRFGINCEMYLDINYNEYAYFTDTGRCWDGDKFNVWDHVKTNKHWPSYHSTMDIIHAIESGSFPINAAITIHPQRWNENLYEWTKELVLQNVKNVVKWGLLQVKKDQGHEKQRQSLFECRY
jgi:hypothetical protein